MREFKREKNLDQKKSRRKILKTISWVSGVILILGLGVVMVRLMIEDERTTRIGKKLNCICKMQCSLTLAGCNCEEPGGAKESKKYIHSLLKQGFSDEKVIALYDEKYPGRLRT